MPAQKATRKKSPQTRRARGSSFEVIGSTGLTRFGGTIDREFHPKLKGSQARKVYREMRDNDPIIGSIFWAVENLIKRAEWRSEPASEEGRAQQESEFLDGVLFEDMSHTFDEFLAEALSHLAFGWSFFEIVYKVRGGPSSNPRRRSKFDDGRIGVRKLSPRSQATLERWVFDEDGGVKAMVQRLESAGGVAVIPIEKALLFRTTSELNNPEGRSLLRNSFRPWYFVKNLEEIEAIGIERDLAGLPKLEVPPEILSPKASSEQKTLRQELENLVSQIRRDEREGLVVPAEEVGGEKTGYRFTLVSTGGRRAIDPGKTITRHQQRMAMTLLAEFLMLGMDKVGSFALATSKATLFGAALTAIMDAMTSVLNRFLVHRLMRMNGVPEEFWPSIVHGDPSEPDLEALSSYVERLVKVGAVNTDEALERHLRMVGNLPEPEEADAGTSPAPKPNGKDTGEDLGAAAMETE